VSRVFDAAAHRPVLLRLARYSDRWTILYHADLAYWSADHAAGTQIRYLCAHTAAELAAKIAAAER